MSVTLDPELTEVIKESAGRLGLSFDDWVLSFDDWVVAAAELKFRADEEAANLHAAANLEEAEEKRRRASLLEYIDEFSAEVGESTGEERAAWQRHEQEAVRASGEYYGRVEAEGA